MKVKTTTTRSAGGVVVREKAGSLYVLLIATHDTQRWTLPKGRLEAGEDVRTAALREVMEETGITARIIGRLDTVEYWFYASRHHRLHKFVEFYLMRYEAGQPAPRFSEVDGVGWYPIEEAYQRAAYASTRKLLLLTYKWWQEREEERERREKRRGEEARGRGGEGADASGRVGRGGGCEWASGRGGLVTLRQRQRPLIRVAPSSLRPLKQKQTGGEGARGHSRQP